jgi:hypothetical protein
MRFRRLCLAIFAFLLFLSEPIQIFKLRFGFNHLMRCIATGFAHKKALSNELTTRRDTRIVNSIWRGCERVSMPGARRSVSLCRLQSKLTINEDSSPSRLLPFKLRVDERDERPGD